VIGDSTFIHSGITGLVNIAYNGQASVVVILDNSTTAMTGGQDHPGTGRSLSGRPGRKLDLAALCRAVGIPNVTVVNPRDLAATEAALRAALAADTPSVVIAQCPCITVYRERGEPRAIDEALCVRCGMCLRTACPAILVKPPQTEGGTGDQPTPPEKPQPVIDIALCAGCNLCAQVCPKEAIHVWAGSGGEAR